MDLSFLHQQVVPFAFNVAVMTHHLTHITWAPGFAIGLLSSILDWIVPQVSLLMSHSALVADVRWRGAPGLLVSARLT
jgi:hypothetical protein